MKKSTLKDIRDYALIIFTFLFLHIYVFAHNSVPTNSMVPTINIGDHLITNRLATQFKTPERGDIVTFLGKDKLIFDEYWIKRVIGLPEEVIDIKNGQVYINGEVLEEYYTLGTTYTLQDGITFPYKVPEGHYFMMGDNRESSLDSRFIGAVPKESINAIGAIKIYPFYDMGVLE